MTESTTTFSALVPTIVALFLAGGLGGSIRAIVENDQTENTITLPFTRQAFALGFLGDLLIGGSAALVGFTFFNVLNQTEAVTKVDVRLLGFGIAAGYAGARILNAALDNILKDKVNRVATKTALLDMKSQAIRLYVTKKYAMAADKFREIFSQDPTDVQVKHNLALSLSYTGAEGEREALRLLGELVSADPSNDEAWYDIACIRSVATFQIFSEREILEPLEKAIALNPEWKDYAKTDEDFDRLRKTEAQASATPTVDATL